jgi:HK97 gp10 family phage protein
MPAVYADLTELTIRLGGAGQNINKVAATVVQHAATDIQKEAMSRAPVKTGKLRGSIQVQLKDANTVQIGPTVPYGTYQEFGTGERGEFPTGPYEIRPKNKPYLVFRTKSGSLVRTKLVHHRGVPPQPYMRPAAQAVLDKIAPDLAQKGALLITKGQHAT